MRTDYPTIQEKGKRLDLKAAFHACRRGPDYIGVELEKLVLDAQTLLPVGYAGAGGIQDAFRVLTEKYAWLPEEDSGRVIALRKNHNMISLEPGGQIELSTAEDENVDISAAAEKVHLEELRDAFSGRDIIFSSLGVQPLANPSAIELMPKTRYKYMNDYYRGRGSAATWMMRATSSIQVIIDYAHEEDAAEKIAAASGLAPVMTAMYANSAISEGRLNGLKSFRAWVWQHTDPDRCGLPECFFDGKFTFNEFIDYARDVPLYFIQRYGGYLPAEGMPFKVYELNGLQGREATDADWISHLGCIFTDVRVRKTLEIRCCDRSPGLLTFSLPVLLKALFYEKNILRELLRMVRVFKREEILESLEEAAKHGLQGRLAAHSLADLASETIRLAEDGIRRLSDAGRISTFERKAFEELKHMIITDRKCPADYTIQDFKSGKSLIAIVQDSSL